MRGILCIAALLALAGCASLSSAGLGSGPVLPSADMRDEPSRFVVVTVVNPSQSPNTRAGATPRGYGAGLYSVSSAAASTVRAIEHDHKLHQVSAWPIESLGVHCVVYAVPEDSTAAQVIASLEKDSRVESVQPLNEFKLQGNGALPTRDEPISRAIYNDPYAKLQRNLEELAVNQAHESARGAGIRVAIIDTGVDYDHPDLKGRVVEHRNFVDKDSRQFPRDLHGTQVAGVIAADAGNDFGIVGVAPEARLLAYKSCWQVNAGQAVCNSFTLAQALEAALTADANIVNLSLSGPSDPLLTRLVERGIERGILFVGAIAPAGVDGGFPAGVAGVLPVASAEDGPTLGRELLAPGREVLTLVPGGHCDFASGNSFATAQVSGTLALILSARRSLTSDQAFQLLSQTSRSVPSANGAITSVNACAALAEALNQSGCAARPARGAVGSASGRVVEP
jgi:subtilisin family serine protease